MPAVQALSPSSTLNPGHSSSTLQHSELSHDPTPPTNEVKPCIKVAIAAQRHPNKAFILLVGNTGHGKSKTINRLVGRNLLAVGRSNLGSTTKVGIDTFKSSHPETYILHRPYSELRFLSKPVNQELLYRSHSTICQGLKIQHIAIETPMPFLCDNTSNVTFRNLNHILVLRHLQQSIIARFLM